MKVKNIRILGQLFQRKVASVQNLEKLVRAGYERVGGLGVQRGTHCEGCQILFHDAAESHFWERHIAQLSI